MKTGLSYRTSLHAALSDADYSFIMLTGFKRPLFYSYEVFQKRNLFKVLGSDGGSLPFICIDLFYMLFNAGSGHIENYENFNLLSYHYIMFSITLLHKTAFLIMCIVI